MGHATNDDLTNEIEDILLKVSSNKIIQLSMNGSNVDLNVFNKISEHVEFKPGKSFLIVGSYRLHSDSAFTSGLSKSSWDIDHSMLTNAYHLTKIRQQGELTSVSQLDLLYFH